MKAIWNDQLLAESEDTVIIENNHYFPMASLDMSFFNASDTQSTCPWKGQASYYSLIVNGKENIDAAWYYPSPKTAAKQLTDRIAFWKGVEILE